MTDTPANTLVVIAPQGSPEKRPRLEKTMRHAASQEWAVEYWGWARRHDENCAADLEPVSRSRTLLTGGGYQGASVRVRYLQWMFKVFVAVLRHRPQTVWALGLETALPVWLASMIVPVRYVFDDADRLVLLFDLPRMVKLPLVFLERRVSRKSVFHIIPGVGRYDYRSSKMRVVANVPDRWQVEQARLRPVQRPQASLVVYVNGWFAPVRGSDFIKKIASKLEGDRRIQFLLASKMDGSEASKLSQLDNVRMLGSVDQVTALAWYKVADVVMTFYDPAVTINRYAEPNKWGDAAKMGSALLVNKEVETALPWVQAGAALTVPWNDVEAATRLLRRLSHDRPTLDTMIGAALEMGRQLESFDEALTPILRGLAEPAPSAAVQMSTSVHS